MSSFLPLRSLRVALLLAAPLVAHAAPAKTTSAEDAALRAHQVVIRELPTQADGAVRVLAIVDVAANADSVWTSLLDFPGRKASTPAIQSVAYYKPSTEEEQWVAFKLSKFGFDIVYHNHYVIDRASGRLEHSLDTSRQNDLEASRGVYELYPSPIATGYTRLTWEVESDFGAAIPTMVQKWMTTSATRDFMSDMARRAEAAASR